MIGKMQGRSTIFAPSHVGMLKTEVEFLSNTTSERY